MGLYTNFRAIEQRLRGKVSFDDAGEGDENKLEMQLVNSLIAEAEAQLELDLMERYAIPFQTTLGEPFSKLPRTTIQVIKTMAELQAMIRILETDYGRGTVVNAENYTKLSASRYRNFLKQSLTRKFDDSGPYLRPPLPSLMLAAHNQEADEGFAGQILVTSRGDGGFPAAQINDPSETFWSGQIDDLG